VYTNNFLLFIDFRSIVNFQLLSVTAVAFSSKNQNAGK